MLVKILRNTMADGKPVTASDKPVEVSESAARTLILMGKAVNYVGDAPTLAPTQAPTLAPTEPPTAPPTEAPTLTPTTPPSEAPSAPPADPQGQEKVDGGGLDDLIPGDPDLESGQEGNGGQEAESLPLNYEQLCKLAADLNIENPQKIKKAVLIEKIKEAQAKAKAQA